MDGSGGGDGKPIRFRRISVAAYYACVDEYEKKARHSTSIPVVETMVPIIRNMACAVCGSPDIALGILDATEASERDNMIAFVVCKSCEPRYEDDRQFANDLMCQARAFDQH